MSQTKLSAIVTSPPTDVMLKLNAEKVTMSRNTDGDWAGAATKDFPASFPLEFRAVGIAGAKWTLTLTFTPVGSTSSKEIKRNGTIPDGTLMSDLEETITL